MAAPARSVAVTLLRRSASGEFECLLIKRGKAPMQHHWALPGGGLEPGETLAQAAQREVREECGVTAEITEPFYVTELLPNSTASSSSSSSPSFSSSSPSPHPLIQFILIHLLARPLREDQFSEVRAGDDAADARWVGVQRIRDWQAATTEDDLLVPQIATVLDRALLHYARLVNPS